ncbi:GNAT family N-acetyltransferase [Endozoicomonas arenosclerae]|uniref:GNAT family N-acetyltransferase n=1 Tax=Endozoicomonas arenosclerae TaxID=1633495 RepID=UPI000783AD7C|nr:GNAT family N-acetyltransferase [Endozoicomonas arenosclerae]
MDTHLPKAKVRAAVAEDFEQVYPLLRKLNDTRFTQAIWKRLFSNLWDQESWSPGYVLDTGEKIVGFLGGLYSESSDTDQDQKFCNLTAWIVDEEYRSSSMMLLMPFLRQKDLVLNSLTSSPEAYAVYKRLGFKDLDTAARVIYPLPSFMGTVELISEPAEIRKLLSKNERECFDAHSGLDVWQCAIKKQDRVCYLLGTRRLGRGHIHRVGNLELFRETISQIRWRLCMSIDVKGLQVDERFLAGKKMVLSRLKYFAQPKQYRGKIPVEKVNASYSELIVLATP